MYIIIGTIWLNIVSFILEIPSIDYYDFIYKYNTLDKGVIYQEYQEGPIIIMGHSGVGKAAVFNNLPYLEKEERINLYYPSGKKTYIIETKKIIRKKNHITLQNNNNYIYLVTCNLNNYDEQWLITAKKV